MVMERYSMDLEKWIYETQWISQSEEGEEGEEGEKKKEWKKIRVQIIEDLNDALFYIHFTKKYCHDDIKSDNILVQKDEDKVHVAISDFGLSIPIEHDGQMSDTWEFAMLVYHILSSGREDNSTICRELKSLGKLRRSYNLSKIGSL